MIRASLLVPLSCAIWTFLSACQTQSAKELARLDRADPIRDAKRALTRGDRRLAVVTIFVQQFPGADSVLGKPAVFQCDWFSVSDQTSDDLSDTMTVSINGAARNYAMQYNLAILRDGKGCKPAPKPAA
jgi:hypothetical protein